MPLTGKTFPPEGPGLAVALQDDDGHHQGGWGWWWKGSGQPTDTLRWPGHQAPITRNHDMSEPNNPATLDRAQKLIAKIAGAESYTAVNLLNLWARGYVKVWHSHRLCQGAGRSGNATRGRMRYRGHCRMMIGTVRVVEGGGGKAMVRLAASSERPRTVLKKMPVNRPMRFRFCMLRMSIFLNEHLFSNHGFLTSSWAFSGTAASITTRSNATPTLGAGGNTARV